MRWCRGRVRGTLDDPGEVLARAGRRKSSQPIVTAELDDNDSRRQAGDDIVDARGPAFGSFAADAGVDHAMFVTLLGKTGLQQCGPGQVYVYAVASRQAVAEHDQYGCLVGCGRSRHGRVGQHDHDQQ